MVKKPTGKEKEKAQQQTAFHGAKRDASSGAPSFVGCPGADAGDV